MLALHRVRCAGRRRRPRLAARRQVQGSDRDPLEDLGDATAIGCSRSDICVDAYSITGRYDEAEATARKADDRRRTARELWNSLGEVLIERGKRAAAESAFVRAGAEHASGQSRRRAQSRRAALGSRRARSRDEGVRSLHRHLQQVGRRRISRATSSSPSRAPSNTSARTIRSSSRTRSRHTTRAIATDPGNADAKIRLGELFLRKYNFDDAQKTFDEVLAQNPIDPRALARRRAPARARRPGRRRLAAARVAQHQSRRRRGAHAARRDARRARGLRRRAGGHRSRAEGQSDRRARARRRGGHQVRHARSGGLRSVAPTRARARIRATPSCTRRSSEMASQLRLYKEAADFAKQGTALDPKSWDGVGHARQQPAAPRADRRRAKRVSRRRSRAIRTACGSRTRSICSTPTRTTI